MHFLASFFIAISLTHATFAQEAWAPVPQSFSCDAPHEVLCNPQTNPHLADLDTYLAGVFTRLEAAARDFDARTPPRDCARTADCTQNRRRMVWLSVFSKQRAAELERLFVETKEDAARFLVEKRAAYMASDAEPELKTERLRLLDLALSRLPTMTALPFQTQEALVRLSPREGTRYFHAANQIEMGFLSLLPSSYDNAIRVVLGHEIAHAFGPSSLFRLDAQGQSLELYGIPVSSLYRSSYPLIDEIGQLPRGYRGADVACLEPIRQELAESLRQSSQVVKVCETSSCNGKIQELNACMKGCPSGAGQSVCQESCAPLREEHRQCVLAICSDEERALEDEHNSNRNRHDGIVRVIANPHDGGNRDAIQCGKAETEEALGDLLGFRWATARLNGDAEEIRKLYLANSTMFCRFIVNVAPQSSRPGTHPEGSDRVNLIHFGVEGVREAHGCR
jgi:hypothetical protein